MNSKFKLTAKRLISGFVAAATAVTMLPQVPAFAETGTTTYSYDGYDVEYSVLNEWDNGQTIEIKVTNTGDDSILNWALKYDAEGEVDNLWNALVYDNQGEDYIIKNGGWNYEIAPGQTVNFGYTLVDDKFETPDDFELCSKRVDMALGYEVALNIIEQWNTGIKAEIVITNTSDKPLEAWTYSFDSNFTIDNLWDARILDSTDGHYTVASEMWTNPIAVGDSKVIGFTASINEDITPEISNGTLTAVEIDSLEINWEDTTDTDGDGLPDLYEKNAYGTDINNPDTDGDRLPDGYEVITLRTNPTSKDTDDNGTTDDEEDFDSDNLTNYEEYLLGTDPYKADTDGDGLTDGDEINIYNTDPLKYDTDGDRVIDGDEILLGLDPNDPTDGDMAIKQSISEDELRVNKYNDNFKISIDVEASNNVKRFIKQGVSRYTGILSDNKSIIGLPISIAYNAGTIKSGTITFRLDDKFVDGNSHFYPELGLGIERYGVFYYDKEVRTIVPLPCEYDDENNTITLDAQYMGDLMIIDYESLMFDLGVKPEEIIAAYDAPMTASFMAEEFDDVETEDNTAESGYSSNEVTDFEDLSLEEIENILNSTEKDESASTFSISPRRAVAKSSAMRQVDLVLVVDTTGSMGSQIAAVKRNLSTLIAKLREDRISLYVSVVDYRDITCDGKNSTKVNNNSGKDFYNSVTDITNVISSLYPNGGGDIPETAIDGLAAAYNLNYRDSSAKFAFLITDANYKNQNNHGITNMTEMARMLNRINIRTSVVTYSSYYRTYENLVETTGGKLIPMNNDFCSAMYDIICSETPGSNVVLADNIVSGFFKEPLIMGGACDTDGDTLSDSDEVDWNFVKKVNIEDGTYELYTWKELCEKTGRFGSDTAYTDGRLNPLFGIMSGYEVIPVTSNPFSADTDKDYYPDNVDDNKLEDDPMYIFDGGINDDNFHDGNPIEKKTSDKYTDGELIVDNTGKTAKYSFVRRPRNYNYTFSLKPNGRSFYKFNLPIDISYEKSWLFYSETVDVEPESDGTYLLEPGTEYTIMVKSAGPSEFVFTVKQDNWVYAPDGGRWKVTQYSNSSVISSSFGGYLMSGTMYVPAARLISSVAELYGNSVETIYVEGGDIEEQIKYLLNNNGMEDDLTLMDIASLVGGGVGVTLIFVSGLGGKVAAIILNATGTALSVAGAVTVLDKMFTLLEKYGFERACRDGNLNISSSHYVSAVLGNVWDPWDTEFYINKISVNGDIGTVEKNITNKEIMDWFGWERTDHDIPVT